jgi:hypothetical protein
MSAELLITLAKRAVGASMVKEYGVPYIVVGHTVDNRIHCVQVRTPTGEEVLFMCHPMLYRRRVVLVNYMAASKLPPWTAKWLEKILSKELQKYTTEVLLEEPAYG